MFNSTNQATIARTAPEAESWQRVFSPGKLTIGLLTPLEAYPDSPFPTLQAHQQLAKQTEDAGFASIWLRDVPFYDPNFGDAPYQRFYNVVRIGRNALLERLLHHRELGVQHVALNLKPSQRSAQAVIDELGEYVLPALNGD